jgi:hypothetical protein
MNYRENGEIGKENLPDVTKHCPTEMEQGDGAGRGGLPRPVRILLREAGNGQYRRGR